MRTSPPDLLPIFRSRLQARLLAALFLGDGEPRVVMELANQVDGATNSVYRELQRLRAAGLVERAQPERGAGYVAAEDSPLYEPLHDLLERTLGVEVLLRHALETTAGVERAAIFGSWAEARPGPDSDIDLLVVGTMERSALLTAVAEVERRARREIDVTIYGREEFERRLAAGSGFLRTALGGALIPLVGDLG